MSWCSSLRTTPSITWPCREAKVIFSPSATTTTTTYDAATETWVTTVSAGNLGEQVFLTGLALPVPAAGLPGNIKPVTMSGRLASTKAGVTLQWEWSAAVYTSFSTDYNALGVKPVSGAIAESIQQPGHRRDPREFQGIRDGRRARRGRVQLHREPQPGRARLLRLQRDAALRAADQLRQRHLQRHLQPGVGCGQGLFAGRLGLYDGRGKVIQQCRERHCR